ncbi:RNA-binding, RBD [Phytophthora megakarya]|uniref:RNA-binding, RBD n=1 Tax=Phytophthora megakarya TaxID=4795 RepID=A0A225W6T8_9STRA|nr:RNA-binding, RBD [Phytophthora megakarya]
MASPRSRSRSRSPTRSPSRRSPSGSRKRSASRSRSVSNARSDGKLDDKPQSKAVTLRVENLTRNVNADHLREIFGKFGVVLRVEMAVPRGKASAVVAFATQKDADSAKSHMHDGWLDGNKLRVLPDAPKVDNNARRTVARRGRFRSPSVARNRPRSPLRGRGRRGASPFRGRSRRAAAAVAATIDEEDRALARHSVDVLRLRSEADDAVHRRFEASVPTSAQPQSQQKPQSELQQEPQSQPRTQSKCQSQQKPKPQLQQKSQSQSELQSRAATT